MARLAHLPAWRMPRVPSEFMTTTSQLPFWTDQVRTWFPLPLELVAQML